MRHLSANIYLILISFIVETGKSEKSKEVH